MRIALISDIHAHLFALDAVLADIRLCNVSATICLGDVATIGPHPREVLDRLKHFGCRCVLGNHDAALLSPDKAGELKVSEELLPSLDWSLSQITESQIDQMKAFEDTIIMPLGDGDSLLCYHGSPGCSTDIIAPMTPASVLIAFIGATKESILAGGHTHTQMRRELNGRILINPGSVGSVFLRPPGDGPEVTLQPWAEYCILEAGDGAPIVEMRKVHFDTEGFLRSTERTDNPLKEWWLTQYRPPS